jgi:DnaJ domain
MAGPDFYKILGVSVSASADEIKAAHRELVKKYHPDLFSRSAEKAQANKKLQQINEAYTILSNAERRRHYDARFVQKASTEPPPTGKRRPSTAAARAPSAAMAGTNFARRINERLRQLNEAYRMLSNAERRRQYGAKLFQTAKTAKSALAARKSRSASGLLHLLRGWKHRARPWTDSVSVKVTGGLFCIMILALISKAMWQEPEAETAWTLIESTVVESSNDNSPLKFGERRWTRLGDHSSKVQCADSLKARVAMDEQEGSKAFLDERSGTIAMTIYVKSEAVLAQEYLQAKLKGTIPNSVDRQLLEQQAREEAKEFVRKNGITQRIKNYQCRETQVVKPESWLRRKLKQAWASFLKRV